MRRFIEDGIQRALTEKVITPRSIEDFGGMEDE